MSYGPGFPAAPSEPPPSPTGHGLHPMTIGRVFELSWRMLKYRWRALFGAAAILLIPAYVGQTIVTMATAAVVNDWLAEWEEWARQLELMVEFAPDEFTELPPFPAFPAGFAEAMLLSIAMGIVSFVLGVLAMAAVVHAAARTYSGAEPSARESASQALRRSPSLVGAEFLAYLAMIAVIAVGGVVGAVLIGQGPGLVAFLGVVLIVLAFAALIVLLIRWIFIEQAIMLEGESAVGALGRSWRLVGGSALRVLGYLLVLGLTIGLIVALVLAALLAVLTGGAPSTDPVIVAVESFVSLVATLGVTAYTTIFMTLLYFDIRWRRNEFGQATAVPSAYGSQPPHYGGGQPPYGGGDQPPYGGGGQPPGGQPPAG